MANLPYDENSRQTRLALGLECSSSSDLAPQAASAQQDGFCSASQVSSTSTTTTTCASHARQKSTGLGEQPLSTHPSKARTARTRPQETSKYFTWTDEDTVRLVDVIHKNEHYQRVLLPGRLTSDQEKGLKTNKDVVCRQVFNEVFPNDNSANGSGRIKSKIRWLTLHYNGIIKKFGHTGSGLLLREMEQDHSVSTSVLLASYVRRITEVLHHTGLRVSCCYCRDPSLVRAMARDGQQSSCHWACCIGH